MIDWNIIKSLSPHPAHIQKPRILSKGNPPLVFQNNNGFLSNYKIFGNTIKNSNTFTDVGEYISDTNSPYYQKYCIPIQISGINMLDLNSVVMNAYINAQGEETQSIAGLNHSDYIKVEPLTVYTLEIYSPTSPNTIAMNWFDSEKNILSARNTVNVAFGEHKVWSVQSPENAAYLIVNFVSDRQNEIMLFKGSDSHTFEPYHEPLLYNIYTDVPVSKTQNEHDVIDYRNSRLKKNIRSLSFTGNENWQKQQNDFLLAISGNKNADIICSHYENADISIDSSHCLHITSSDFNSADTFKNYLSSQNINGTPVTIYYAADIPEIYTLELPNIPTLDGTNILAFGTSVQPDIVHITCQI